MMISIHLFIPRRFIFSEESLSSGIGLKERNHLMMGCCIAWQVVKLFVSLPAELSPELVTEAKFSE
jgi:hypothetical protein